MQSYIFYLVREHNRRNKSLLAKEINVKWCEIGIYLLILHRFWDDININNAKKQNEYINNNRNSEQQTHWFCVECSCFTHWTSYSKYFPTNIASTLLYFDWKYKLNSWRILTKPPTILFLCPFVTVAFVMLFCLFRLMRTDNLIINVQWCTYKLKRNEL